MSASRNFEDNIVHERSVLRPTSQPGSPMTVASENLFSIAIFPYLKTSGPVQIGPYTFRSTDDIEGLSEAEATAVAEVTGMLYAQNNARVRPHPTL